MTSTQRFSRGFAPSLIGALLIFPVLSAAQDQSVEPEALLAKIAQKYSAKQFAFEGDLELARKSGEHTMEALAKAKVKLAIAPGGKFLLRVEKLGKSSFVIVSDGQKSWAYVPELKKYTMQDAAALVTNEDPNQSFEDPQLHAKTTIIDEFSRRVMPMLARLAEGNPSAFINGAAQVKFEGKPQAWPVLTVVSRSEEKDGTAGESLLYLTIDPATLNIGRILWTKPIPSAGEKILVRLAVDFDNFHVGEPIPDSEFSFTPPQGTKRVDSLPVPGQEEASFLNKPAPDFELSNREGHPVRLTNFKGSAVLLDFSASWCGPCGQGLPLLSKLSDEYKDKGLAVLQINQESKDGAVSAAKEPNLTFDSLKDPGEKVAQLYRVRAVPTLLLVNRKGLVVRVFQGVPDEKTLRAALKVAGL